MFPVFLSISPSSFPLLLHECLFSGFLGTQSLSFIAPTIFVCLPFLGLIFIVSYFNLYFFVLRFPLSSNRPPSRILWNKATLRATNPAQSHTTNVLISSSQNPHFMTKDVTKYGNLCYAFTSLLPFRNFTHHVSISRTMRSNIIATITMVKPAAFVSSFCIRLVVSSHLALFTCQNYAFSSS